MRGLVFAAILAVGVWAGSGAAASGPAGGGAAEPRDLIAEQGRGGGGGAPQAQTVDPLRFRYMGPAPAGRIIAAAGVPGDLSTYYLGSASGGVWKSTDNGTTFAPVSDDMTAAAIGALAITPSDPNIVWAGTGEAWVIRPSDVMGDGVYKSSDAGKTWKNMGLAETGRIGAIIVHPTDPNIVYVCAVGRGTGPQQERGVFKTTDGGADLDAVAVRERRHRLLGPVDGRERSEYAHRRHLAARAAHLAAVQRRTRQRRVHHARRRRQVGARRSRHAARPDGQGGRRDRAVELEAHVRADPDGRPGFASGAPTTRARRSRS